MIIPFCAAHFFVPSFTNSFPLSNLIHFGTFPKFHSTLVMCSLIWSVVSPLCFKNRMALYCVQSSTNEIYHFHHPMDFTLAVPQTSDIICSPGISDLCSASFRKGLCTCLAWIHASHVFDGFDNWSIESPLTIPFWDKRSREVMETCPYHWCNWSHFLVMKHGEKPPESFELLWHQVSIASPSSAHVQ